MARINLKCDDCSNKFNLMYLFMKPDKVKCPVCGSLRVREETVENRGCGCSSSQERPFKLT